MCFGGGLKGMKTARRHLYLNMELYSNLYGRGCPVLLPCTCISDQDHDRVLVFLADRLIFPLHAMYKLKKARGSLIEKIVISRDFKLLGK